MAIAFEKRALILRRVKLPTISGDGAGAPLKSFRFPS